MMEEDQQMGGTPRPTPLKGHSYLSSANLSATPARHIQRSGAQEEGLTSEHEGVIYGTTIAITRTIADIRFFLLNFQTTVQRGDESISEKIYLVKLTDWQKMEGETLETVFNIDAGHLYEYSQTLYLQLIYFPVEIISCFDNVLHELFERQFIESETDTNTRAIRNHRKQELRAGFLKLQAKDQSCIKDLNPSQLGRLVSLTGVVVRMSEIYPEMKTAFFKCIRCSYQVRVVLENARVEQPKSCSICKGDTMELIHNMCQFTNKQYIKFQELLQNLSQGQSPASITLIAYDASVDSIRPGDCVEITGIYRCSPVKINRGRVHCRTIFSTYFDIISQEIMEDKTRRIKASTNNYTEEQKRVFFNMADDQDIVTHLVSSFAPSIYGHKEIKKGILAQLFGGNRGVQGGRKHRADINVCLVGDPSTAKSQMLQQVHKIAPRSIYTCGRGSTGVGLTANVKKDPETREFVLESGALVLSDQGICCIDQFDKMTPNIHTILLEVMEQQTISIAKAGIICQLNSRTSILAAANPIKSKYDPKKTVIENINMPPALLSRFDLIYIMLDIPNMEEDKKIASYILDIYTKNPVKTKRKGKYSMELLTNFITFARTVKPVIGDQAAMKLKEEYLRLRKAGQSFNTISATPRLLESLIRLSQAFAKMRLSSQVSGEDAVLAIDLINFATLKSATDPQTGIIDMDMIATGRTSSMKKKIKELAEKIKALLAANEAKYSSATPIGRFESEYKTMYPGDSSFTKEEILEGLKLLESYNHIYLFGNYQGKKVFKLQQFNEA